MLQRLTEDLEYHELLDRAAKCENSLEQLCYVAAFTVSSYSTTVFRTSKPFNPLLGETFELDRLEENGYRSICEQVTAPGTVTHVLFGERPEFLVAAPAVMLPVPVAPTAFSSRASALAALLVTFCCGRGNVKCDFGRLSPINKRYLFLLLFFLVNLNH